MLGDVLHHDTKTRNLFAIATIQLQKNYASVKRTFSVDPEWPQSTFFSIRVQFYASQILPQFQISESKVLKLWFKIKTFDIIKLIEMII